MPELGVDVIVNGANLDDRGDYRPGMQAAREHGVRSPLIEAGLTKAATFRAGAQLGAAGVDKPATPCLSSRIAYGVAARRERVSPRRPGRAIPSPRVRLERELPRPPRSQRPGPDRSARGRAERLLDPTTRLRFTTIPISRLQIRDARPRRLPLRQHERGTTGGSSADCPHIEPCIPADDADERGYQRPSASSAVIGDAFASIRFPAPGTPCVNSRISSRTRFASLPRSSGCAEDFRSPLPCPAPSHVFFHAAGRQGGGADADAAGVERLALVEGDHVLVDGDAGAVEGCLGDLAGQAQRRHVDQHQVVVGAAADEPEAAGAAAPRPAPWRWR